MGKSNRPENLGEILKDAEPIYICLDPDAREEAFKLAATLGLDRCRLVELPDKIDDMILRSHLDKWWVRSLFKTAVKP
jgi:hypothetical protein